MERQFGLDILRCIAALFVIAGHFYILNTPFMEQGGMDLSLFVQGMLVQLFMTAVPLFVLLTGYLNTKKQPELQYYKKIFRVLFSYLFFSVLSFLFRVFYLHESIGVLTGIKMILNFSIFPYAWYIEMWIGLFLITPFLNTMFRELTKNKKLVLICVLFVITVLPHWVNRNGIHLLPNFWSQCWPLTLFYVGSYIKEYQPSFKKPCLMVFMLLVLLLINPAINTVLRPNHFTLFMGGPEDILSFIISILLFVLIYKSDCCDRIGKVLSIVSAASLDIYMCCWIFDQMTYPWFLTKFYHSQSQFGITFIFIIPILVFILSAAVAIIKRALGKFAGTICKS